jgi:hypothetical protein
MPSDEPFERGGIAGHGGQHEPFLDRPVVVVHGRHAV